MMTKKHFEGIARVLRDDRAFTEAGNSSNDYTLMSTWQKGAYDQFNTLVLNLTDYLATQNPNFDRARFLKAAGVQS